jgi:hypothetical protein
MIQIFNYQCYLMILYQLQELCGSLQIRGQMLTLI